MSTYWSIYRKKVSGVFWRGLEWSGLLEIRDTPAQGAANLYLTDYHPSSFVGLACIIFPIWVALLPSLVILSFFTAAATYFSRRKNKSEPERCDLLVKLRETLDSEAVLEVAKNLLKDLPKVQSNQSMRMKETLEEHCCERWQGAYSSFFGKDIDMGNRYLNNPTRSAEILRAELLRFLENPDNEGKATWNLLFDTLDGIQCRQARNSIAQTEDYQYTDADKEHDFQSFQSSVQRELARWRNSCFAKQKVEKVEAALKRLENERTPKNWVELKALIDERRYGSSSGMGALGLRSSQIKHTKAYENIYMEPRLDSMQEEASMGLFLSR